MSLASGTRLGPYEILSALGAGGMGEVYRARDTKLKRDVAVKVLPDLVASDPDRLARFHREAEVLATLNHANIAHIYGFEDSEGSHALVMELVEGPTLADRIAQGPVTIAEALPIARQIAEALEAAHEQGIIHRDLKPANIKVREDGTVKVLDFGLAKLTDPVAASTPGVNTMSPTLTSPLGTMAGVILGTAAYMAPEQARGKTVDKRADIWAFGAVLYEMLTGRRAFDGDDLSLTLAAVMMKDPDWAGLPGGVTGSVRTLLRRCLERDPKNRLRDIGEARIRLEQSLKGESDERNQVQHVVPQQRSRVAPILVAVLSLLLLSVAVGIYGARPPQQNEVQFDIASPDMPNAYQVTVSPDGRVAAFVARVAANSSVTALWIRPLSSRVAQPLAGTEGAINPFWSPDGRYVGFAAEGKLKKIAVTGGPAQTLCDVTNFAGATWNRQGVIVFSAGVRLSRISATGGPPIAISNLDAQRQEYSHAWPYFLPDGTHLLYLARSAVAENGAIFVASLDSPERTLVINTDSMGVYVPPGYLLFARDGALMALAFEPRTLKTSGDPIRIADDVGMNRGTGRVAFAASETGTLVYRSDVRADISRPTWFDRGGQTLGTAGEEGPYRSIALSPDQKRAAVSRLDLRTRSLDIWVLEFATNILTRLTTDPANDDDPVWAPDGQAVAFWSNRKGKYDFYLHTIGRGEDTPLFESPDATKYIDDWSKDGKFLLYRVATGTGAARALMALPLSGEQKPITLMQSPSFTKDEAHFSPDGRWVAFNSNESGSMEVYVASFPAFENRRQVSSRGGGVPRWAGNGTELFYLSPDGKMMAVAVKPGSTLEFGPPTTLFQTPIRSPSLTLDQYAVSADGKRFLMLSPTSETTAIPITVVVNWPNAVNR